MSFSHTFATITSPGDLREQDIELAEEYEVHRSKIEAGRDIAAQVIESDLVDKPDENGAYSAYVSGDSGGGSSTFSVTVNTVVAPSPGPDAPADEVAQPAPEAPQPDVADQPADDVARDEALAGGPGGSPDPDTATGGESGSTGDARPGETL